jgi:hypothetical protein
MVGRVRAGGRSVSALGDGWHLQAYTYTYDLPTNLTSPNGDRSCYARRWLARCQVYRRLALGLNCFVGGSHTLKKGLRPEVAKLWERLETKSNHGSQKLSAARLAALYAGSAGILFFSKDTTNRDVTKEWTMVLNWNKGWTKTLHQDHMYPLTMRK